MSTLRCIIGTQGWFLNGPGAYIPNFSPISPREHSSQWAWSSGQFYIVKQWFLAIFRCQSNIVLGGVRSSGVSQNVKSPVYFTFQKIFPYKIFQNVLRHWVIAHFLKYQNWHHWRHQMAWKHHQWMPVTWYICKWHPTCHTKCQEYPVIQASKGRHGGQGESWQGYSCQNRIKLWTYVLYTIVNLLTFPLFSQEPNCPPRLQDEHFKLSLIHISEPTRPY